MPTLFWNALWTQLSIQCPYVTLCYLFICLMASQSTGQFPWELSALYSAVQNVWVKFWLLDSYGSELEGGREKTVQRKKPNMLNLSDYNCKQFKFKWKKNPKMKIDAQWPLCLHNISWLKIRYFQMAAGFSWKDGLGKTFREIELKSSPFHLSMCVFLPKVRHPMNTLELRYRENCL